MNDGIFNDRGALLVMAADGVGYDEARLRLERASLVLDVGDELDAAHQAACLAAARCAVRMFAGGLFMSANMAGRATIGQERSRLLARALIELGAKTAAPPEHAVRLAIGVGARPGAHLYASCDGWQARIGPKPFAPARTGNVLSGAAAGALAVAELFRKVVLDDVRAARRDAVIDLWGAEAAPDRIPRLPRQIWLLGLGNLGQATLFLLSLLPWADPADVILVLNDDDRAGPENLPVQILTDHSWIGEKKARAAARWAEARGFQTIVDERRFGSSSGPQGDEPRLVLVGVDNLPARRHAAAAGFNLVIDAGLGATGSEAFDIRIHGFPGTKSPEKVWPESSPEPPSLSPSLSDLVAQNRLDPCGAMTIAGKTVGMPSTAVVAAALQVAQACRAVMTGRCADRIDASLIDLTRTTRRDMPEGTDIFLPSVATY